MNSLLKNSLYNLAKTASKVVFPLLTFSYASRILTPNGLGKIEFANSYVAYFSLLAMLGISNYATREAAKLRNEQDKLNQFVSEILCINLFCVAIAILFFAFSLLLFPALNPYRLFLIVTSASIPLTALGIEWLYAALEDYRYITLRTIAFQIIVFCSTVIFVKSENDALVYAIINVALTCGSNIINIIYAKKYFSPVRIHGTLLLRHLSPILIMFGMTVCVQIFTHLDALMLGFMVSEGSVGLYAVATKMVNVVTSILVSATAVLAPRIAFYTGKKKYEEIASVSYHAFDILLLLSILACVLLSILSPQLVIVFSGPTFLPAVHTAKILSARVLLAPLNTFLIIHLFIPIGKEKYNIVSTTVAALVNVVANFLLIPTFEESGAAFATVLSEILELGINLYYVKSILQIKVLFKHVFEYIAGAGIVFILWNLTKNAFSSGLMFVPFAFISGLAYVITLLFYKNENLTKLHHYVSSARKKGA